MIHEAYESKLRSVVRSSMHSCQGNWVSAVQSCIMPGMPTHLVQELNVGTVVVVVEEVEVVVHVQIREYDRSRRLYSQGLWILLFINVC